MCRISVLCVENRNVIVVHERLSSCGGSWLRLREYVSDCHCLQTPSLSLSIGLSMMVFDMALLCLFCRSGDPVTTLRYLG